MYVRLLPALLISLCLTLCAPPAGAENRVLTNALLLPPVGSYGRMAVYSDALEPALTDGTWTAPGAGDIVRTPDGEQVAWGEATADDEGWFDDSRLAGGYAFFAVNSGRDQVALLEARGHATAVINGATRAPNPYAYDWLHLPVRLRKGRNEFLFRVGRGRLRVALGEPPADVFLTDRDTTLPDVIRGDDGPLPAGIVLTNATDAWQRDLVVRAACGDNVRVTQVDRLAPMTLCKWPIELPRPADTATNQTAISLTLHQGAADTPALHPAIELTLRIRNANQQHNRTFRSQIDGSVQYYAVMPRRTDADAATGSAAPAQDGTGLILTLHGASVDATNQANAYAGKPWATIVAPTNRRPYGFDWEQWGRMDALEVLKQSADRYEPNPERVCLTGHSMGGHGTWNFGATFPDRFAAIAPSAGWVDFWSYTGIGDFDASTEIGAMMKRATNPSRTRHYLPNLAQYGVYVLHGDADDNVPVAQARIMRQLLGTFHTDFAYHEQPGAGHWWGNQCVDWPPLMDFLERRTRQRGGTPDALEFVTCNPAINARCHWIGIQQQQRMLMPSRAELRRDPASGTIHGETENVATLLLDVTDFQRRTRATSGDDARLRVELDGTVLEDLRWPETGALRLVRAADGWEVGESAQAGDKGGRRGSGLKEAIRNHVTLVYGTSGDEATTRWAYHRARCDAETFYYRGNGRLPIYSDQDYLAWLETAEAGEVGNVILYGNAESNAAWSTLLGTDCPVGVTGERVAIGERTLDGEHLAVLFTYPRAGSDTLSVVVIGGTDLTGMRMTDRLPLFLAGSAYPDLLIFDPAIYKHGYRAIRAAGYFGNDWRAETGEFVIH